jgi:hypothetical protein
MNVEFICGCVHEVDLSNPDEIGWWRVIATDRMGYIVCASHRVRRKVWRSMPTVPGKQHVPDYSYAKYTPLQLERHFIFGEPLPERELELANLVPDMRDNRDPAILGAEIMSKSNGHR